MTALLKKSGLQKHEAQKRRRILSLWLPYLATDRLGLGVRLGMGLNQAPAKNTSKAPLPHALTDDVHGLHRIVRTDAMARQAGVIVGTPLADARAMVPNLQTQPWDQGGDTHQLRRLAHWATRFSPWTRPWDRQAEGDGLWLDITGCAHLFGGETDLLKQVVQALGQAGYTAKGAIADTPGAAWATAHYGGVEQTIVPPGEQRDALSVLPVAGLRLAPDICDGLNRLGLSRIDSLYPLPRASLALRFGLSVGERLDQALGRTFEPLDPLAPPPTYRTRMTFAEPIGTRDDLKAALDRLLPPLCDQLAQAGRGVRRLAYTLYRVDGTTAEAVIGTRRPVRDAAHLVLLFQEKMDRLDPGFGIEAASLNALETEPQPAHQQAICNTVHPNGSHAADTRALEQLVDKLENRLSPGSVFCLVENGSHLPEKAQTKQTVGSVFESNTQTDQDEKGRLDHAPVYPPLADRPLYLLPTPEPLDLPPADGGKNRTPFGAPFAFHWRRQTHRLVSTEGPERIAGEWWHSLQPSDGDGDGDGGETASTTDTSRSCTPSDTRDYYRVEDDQGGRFWLFRDGNERWFLHGVFP